MFVAAMGALAIFASVRRLLRYALDLRHRKPLTIDAWENFGRLILTAELDPGPQDEQVNRVVSKHSRFAGATNPASKTASIFLD